MVHRFHKEFKIVLDPHPGTGYCWGIVSELDANVVELVGIQNFSSDLFLAEIRGRRLSGAWPSLSSSTRVSK